MSLNPALEDAGFCPRCGAAATVRFPRSLHCESCGYAVFFNPKPVGCALARDADGRVWLARRGHDPGRGRWSMPGGFVDLGESVEDAAIREVEEELHLRVELSHLIGVYSSAQDRTVVVVYAATTTGTPTLTEEALEVRAFAPTNIPWQDLAFLSDEKALSDHLGVSAAGCGSKPAPS